jgi:hypothetical protein
MHGRRSSRRYIVEGSSQYDMRGRIVLSPGAERRVQLGFAAQPFVAAGIGFGLFPIVAAFAGGGRISEALEAAIVFGVLVGIVATIITGCVAYPTFRWLLKRGRVTCAHTLAAGIALGNIPAGIGIIVLVATAVSR